MIPYLNLNFSDFLVFIVLLVVAVLALIVTRKLLHVSGSQLIMGFLGLIFGLWIGSLLAQPLSSLPGNLGRYLPLTVSALVTVAVVDIFLAQTPRLVNTTATIRKLLSRSLGLLEEPKIKPSFLVDTSVLIDGRLKEIAKASFIFGDLLVPRFVLDELQTVADSEDDLKRERGRRGIEVLNDLRKNPEISISVIDELPGKGKVDLKLIRVAETRKIPILTVDYNLNRLAAISGVRILNINELAQSLRPALIPGETLRIKIVQEGKEPGQGVGYLPDGTMIVVEEGAQLLGKEVECEVERIFQTVAGKMIFVKPKK